MASAKKNGKRWISVARRTISGEKFDLRHAGRGGD
jgi:hypothetical protein